MEHKIPSVTVEIDTPKIWGTNIPNIFGTAIFTYENGMKKLVPLYYIQKLCRSIIKVLLLPFALIKRSYYKNRYKHSRYFKYTQYQQGTGMTSSMFRPDNVLETKK